MCSKLDTNQQDLPIVSIIIPAYTAEKTIGCAIESVISQTFQSWELIIIDDGSSDSTSDIVSQYMKIDQRISLLCNNINMGVSESRNRGMSAAKGQWIAFLDSDDLWQSDKLKCQLELAYKVNASFVFTGCSYINHAGDAYQHTFIPADRINYEKYKWNNVITCSSVLIEREVLHGLCFEDDSISEDYLMWLKVLKRTELAYCVQAPLTIYRLLDNSRSSNKLKMIRQAYMVHRRNGETKVRSMLYSLTHIILAFWNKYRYLI